MGPANPHHVVRGGPHRLPLTIGSLMQKESPDMDRCGALPNTIITTNISDIVATRVGLAAGGAGASSSLLKAPP